ncbi:MAG: winged helix-turn-helix transcriptional regulator [Promethearchaeota archaeon]
MVFHNKLNWKYQIIIAIILFLILFDYSILICYAKASKQKNIPGFWTEDTIQPNERVSYHFLNNITFEISSNTLLDIYIEYENGSANKQTSFIVNNEEPISLNFTSKSSLKNFGSIKQPKEPKQGKKKIRFDYDLVFNFKSNGTINNFTIQYLKTSQFGLDPDSSYSLVLFKMDQDAWQIIETHEKLNSSSSESYLESSLLNVDANTDYYITLIEIGIVQYDWTWLYITIPIIIIATIAIIILISKKDYFRYLKTRTIPIEKGAHRLSLDDVLENENRNKIIDLILSEPGIHFNELLRKTGLAAGNLVWHLDILETYKVIGKKRIGNFIAYFPYYQKNPISNIDLKLQKSKLTLEVLEMIEDQPGVWNNLITKKFKVDHKTILYHIKKLRELNLINIKKEGRRKRFFPNLESEYFKYKKDDEKD